MKFVTLEISKEQYDEYKDRPRELGNELIDPATFMGYGVYGMQVYEDHGKYVFRYEMGDSCD